jgi:RNA polymerase sigma-70 factor (ECF subfamily)
MSPGTASLSGEAMFGDGTAHSCTHRDHNGRNTADEAAVQSALSGDQSAFKYLYDKYHAAVLKTCLEFSRGDSAQAHDLCQETFISAFLKLNQLRDRTRFFPWLTEIVRNKCLSFYRKQRTILKVLREYQGIKQVILGGESDWTEAELRVIEDLMRSLESEELKETIRLYYIEGKRTPEIARLQTVSQSAITMRLSRFRTKLRKRLACEILRRSSPPK